MRFRSSRRASFVAGALVLAHVLAIAPVSAEVVITDECRAHFKAGVNLLSDVDGARYEEAYREFKVAYASCPSYKILGNLGLCAMKLERDGEAIEAYDKYLSEGGKDIDPGEKGQVSIDLTTLKTGAATLEITAKEPAEGLLLVDTRIPNKGDRVINQYPFTGNALSVKVRSGHHVLLIKAEGYESLTLEIDLNAGGTHKKEITLKKPTVAGPAPTSTTTTPPPPPPATKEVRPVPTGVWIGMGVAGALLIGGGVTGVMAMGKNSEYKTANDGRDPVGAEKLRKDGQTLNLVTDVLIGGAVLAAGVTTYLYLARPTEQVPATDAGKTKTWIAPSIGATSGGLVLGGHF